MKAIYDYNKVFSFNQHFDVIMGSVLQLDQRLELFAWLGSANNLGSNYISRRKRRRRRLLATSLFNPHTLL